MCVSHKIKSREQEYPSLTEGHNELGTERQCDLGADLSCQVLRLGKREAFSSPASQVA